MFVNATATNFIYRIRNIQKPTCLTAATAKSDVPRFYKLDAKDHKDKEQEKGVHSFGRVMK